jgi:ribosome maturation factor RimP
VFVAGKGTKRDFLTVCQTVTHTFGFELVDAGVEKEGAGRYLRIYIDKPGGVSLNDCEVFHRAVQPELEHIDYDFLEVSSPGVERPLKTERDFLRCAGKAVSVKLFQPVDGKKEYEGRLEGLEAGEVVVGVPGGQVFRFPQRAVAIVRPILRMEESDGL